MKRLIAAVLLCLLSASAAPFAAAAETVDSLIKRGVDLMAKRDYIAAMDAFRRAHETAPSPRTFAQVGFVYMALGRWVEAEDQLLQAIAEPEDRWARRNRGVLNDSLARVRERLGYLEITGEPKGAEIRIDGELVGLLPMRKPVRMPVGRSAVTISASGFRKLERSAAVRTGETTRLHISLERVAPTPPEVALPAPPAPPAQVAHASSPPVERARPVHRLGVSLSIAGPAVLVAGLSTMLLADDRETLGAGLIGGGTAGLVAGVAFLWASAGDERVPVAVAIGPKSASIAFSF
jgi:hypothetical protein